MLSQPRRRRVTYQCPQCDEIFIDQESLDRHALTHNPAPTTGITTGMRTGLRVGSRAAPLLATDAVLLDKPATPRECRPDLPPVCQECGQHCPDLRALLNHWGDKHWTGPGSLPQLRQRLGKIEARTVNPARPEGLEIELTLCLQPRLAFYNKRAQDLRQKLLREIGLDRAIHFSCIGWTNHPQGSYRIFLRGRLLHEDVTWPGEPGLEEIFWTSVERVCRENQAWLRPHQALHPDSGLVLEASSDLYPIVCDPYMWAGTGAPVVVASNSRLSPLTLSWHHNGQSLRMAQLPEAVWQLLQGPPPVLSRLGRLITIPLTGQLLGSVPYPALNKARNLGCTPVEGRAIIRSVVRQGLLLVQN